MKAITVGQRTQCVTVITDAARKGSASAIEELVQSGILNGDNMQRILGQGNYVSAKIRKSVKRLLTRMAENATVRLKLISGAETLILGPTDGTAVIAEARSLFSYLDKDFMNWKTNVKGKPTEAQNVEVHEATENGTFEQIYCGLGTDLNALCLSQAQIIQFVENYRNWLCADGNGTFFLFKVDDRFFVAGVRGGSDVLLSADIYRFSYDISWRTEFCNRFVVPKLTLASASVS